MSSYHTPIMVEEVISLLLPQRGGLFVDGTLGAGGHAKAMLQLMPATGKLIGIDRDKEAIKEASAALTSFKGSFEALHGNFFNMKELLAQKGIHGVDGMLLDLGVSSHQLDDKERGFSYHIQSALDMRMDKGETLTAAHVVNTYSFGDLARILRDYGEERYAAKIAAAIVREREKAPITDTLELAEIIKRATPPNKRYEGKHPARRSFQGIRIEVNKELDGLKDALEKAIGLLNKDGRIAVITFHSLEDRIVKQLFANLENPCICKKQSPVCVCNKKPLIKRLNKKAIVPSQEEINTNQRARSAKLRAAIKI